METIWIRTTSRRYPVFVGQNVMETLPAFIHDQFSNITSLLIITDETVGGLFLPRLTSLLADFHPEAYIVPAGEKAKTFDVYYNCLTFALEKKLDRKSLIIAFGGGAVGDLAGFVAATFMRGIPFIQVPTTILAHDSAVGGKVAINHPLGKNMIGAFFQPEAVFYDIEFLETLPPAEKRSGFAEVIKHGLIKDRDLFEWLQSNIKSLENLSNDDLQFMLARGIQVKESIVSKDEKETGIRAFLNLGHTLGHAIEAEMGYGKITHGEAVLIGICFALELSEREFGFSYKKEEFLQWIRALGYKTDVPNHLSSENLVNRMKMDKKTVGQKIRFVLLEQVGRPVLKELEDERLLAHLEHFRSGGGM
ncbi:3-dehydroquinate synthase [Bacillus methanolicus]|uniref:3-dehydroquinate synthase n=1 Tax=Bacillus methanolicus TaxID=1471 RepID=UPI0020104989|nr:3-dehydroquinate synthase [Bacillus methanolicus]UQD52553.1 3-dehydroquinate synthase [Bacillus methanolicus]